MARIQDGTQVDQLLEMVALRTAELLNRSSLAELMGEQITTEDHAMWKPKNKIVKILS